MPGWPVNNNGQRSTSTVDGQAAADDVLTDTNAARVFNVGDDRSMRVLRILFKVVLALVAIVVLAGVVVYVLAGRRIDRTYQVTTPPVEVPTDGEAIARGKRLVTVVAPCNDCHGDDFGGKVMINEWAMGKLHSANLTR